MAEYQRAGGGGGGVGEHHRRGGAMSGAGGQQEQQSMAMTVAKASVSAMVGGSMLLLSGLSMTGTIIVLVVATPALVIFIPVLMPAAIAVALLAGGFLLSGGFGVAALSVLSWMYRYLTGKHPMGVGQIDHARARLAAKAHDVKESAQNRLDQARAS